MSVRHIVAMIVAGWGAAAQSEASPLDYSKLAARGGDGTKIDTDEEIRILALHEASETYSQMDADFDGVLSDEELRAFRAKVEEAASLKAFGRAEELIEDLHRPRPVGARRGGKSEEGDAHGPVYPMGSEYLRDFYGMAWKKGTRSDIEGEVAETDGSKASLPAATTGGGYLLSLRKEHKPPYPRLFVEGLGVTNDSAYADALKDADGAKFGFYRDYEDDLQYVSFNGALIWSKVLNQSGSNRLLHPSLLFGDSRGPNASTAVRWHSISLDRIDAKGASSKVSSSEKNDLTLRTGIDVEFAGFGAQSGLEPSTWDWIYSAALQFNTDTGFRKMSTAIEYELEPISPRWGIGASRSVPGLNGILDYRLRTVLHNEVGYIIDPGRDTRVEEGEVFWRAGPRIEATFWPTSRLVKGTLLDGSSLKASYQYYWGLEGALDQLQYYELEAKVPLKSDNWDLTATFRNGTEGPSYDEDIKIVDVGLSTKF